MNEALDRVTYTIQWVMIFEPVPPAGAEATGEDGGQGETAGEGGGL
jgi:hypothetical protein